EHPDLLLYPRHRRGRGGPARAGTVADHALRPDGRRGQGCGRRRPRGGLMLVTGSESVLVQGLTGRQGSFWGARMVESGTNIVAGSSPGRGGREVDGVPVYNTVAEAAQQHQIDATVMFVPAMLAKEAALEAIAAGVKKIVLLAEHVPYHDTMVIMAEAKDAGTQVLGPNTAGLVVPDVASLGIMPAFAKNIFRPGRVGVVSRSG